MKNVFFVYSEGAPEQGSPTSTSTLEEKVVGTVKLSGVKLKSGKCTHSLLPNKLKLRK